MAVSVEGATLTAAHRSQQIALRTSTASTMLRLWAAFDAEDISGSWVALEPAIVALIEARQPTSSALAGGYFSAFRRAEQIAGAARPRLAATPVADDLIPNLRTVGPINALRLVQLRRPADYITQVTLSNVEGEVARQVLNGGRQTLLNSIDGDPRALGYTRVTDGSPCAFCALLAGRGPVYRSEDSGAFQAHRKCGCTAEPVYRSGQPWPPSAQRYDGLYREAAKAVPKNTPDWSAEVRREFRRRYEAA